MKSVTRNPLTIFNIGWQVLASAIRQLSVIKAFHIDNEDLQLSLFIDDFLKKDFNKTISIRGKIYILGNK